MIALALLLPPLFALSAFFSGAETVLFSLTGAQRARIRAADGRADAAIDACLADKAVLFSTILVGNTVVNFAISTIGYHLFSAWLPFGGAVAVPVMTLLLLAFGEITPKRLALRHAERLAAPCARLLTFWRALLGPLNRVLKSLSRAFAPALERERRALSDEELVSVLDSAVEHGEFTAADAGMIEGALRLSELCANDEMTPRVDMEGVDADRPGDFAPDARHAHRHVPVYRRTPDAIEGVLDTATGEVEDALFVPETISLDDLLVMFAKSRKPLAIVTDEYGGTAGVITPNDILEIVVGPGVFSDPGLEPRLEKVGADAWEIDARASIDEINRELDVSLEAEDADRLSGWVQFHAGRIPHVGQEIVADGCRATVLKRRRRRVTLVRMEVLSRRRVKDDRALVAETDEAVERTEEDG